MFKIIFNTIDYRPDLQVTLRNNVDGWDIDVPGIYLNDGWLFDLPETRYAQGMQFKFVLETTYWMQGGNLFLLPEINKKYAYNKNNVAFPPISEVVVESSFFQNNFFKPNLNENHVFDTIVIGSGIGGGIVAEQLADLGGDVLLLEAGSLLFLTHIANLPRQQKTGVFDKHLWGLFDEYKVTNYVNAPGSAYQGGQAFNLGGRSAFWGGFIPRMNWWELEFWPEDVRWYLESAGYQKAEDLMYWPAKPPQYQEDTKKFLKNLLPDFNHFDAPMAVRNQNQTFISTGLFSTNDLLTESKLSEGVGGNNNLSINLNHAVTKIETNGNKATGVVVYDLLAKKYRTFKAKHIVLSAGTVESAKLALMSNLKNQNGLIGKGITDHPIFFTHFSVPEGKPMHSKDFSSKTLSQHKQSSAIDHPFNILIELGADLNQGRYLDADIFKQHMMKKNNAMLCEIVFLFNSALINDNTITHNGPSVVKPLVNMKDSNAANDYWNEVNDLKNKLVAELGGQVLANDNLQLNKAPLGGVAHEVGTLRLGKNNGGVVDENLKFNGYDNLFVCDLSVFPASPAANPTLTLAALAIRLSEHLKSLL